MRFEEEERKKLDRKKQAEKEAAINEVFRNNNEQTGKFEHEREKWDEKGNKALEMLEKEEAEEKRK